MVRSAFAAVLLAAGFALPGCQSIAVPQPRLHDARELVERKCGGCHAVDMADVSANIDAPPLRDLFKRYPVYALDEALRRGLRIGHYDMPQFTLTADETTAIVDYLKGLDPCAKPSSDDKEMRRCFAPL